MVCCSIQLKPYVRIIEYWVKYQIETFHLPNEDQKKGMQNKD